MICGTGGYTGPLPGDPDNVVTISAAAAFGGIDVSWSYPAVNPHAVAHVLLYRGVTANFALATQIAVVAGNRYYDKLDNTTTYYYWIRIVSVNGTLGAQVGPASASARTLVHDLIEQLTGEIDAGVLANTLKAEIDKITLNHSELLDEIQDRLDGDDGLSVTVSQVQGNVDSALAAVQSEITARVDGDDALAEQIDLVAVANQDLAAVVETQRLARIAGDGALSLRVDDAFTASDANAAAIQDVTQAKIGYAALASDPTVAYDGDNATIVYALATYPAATYPAYALDRKRIIDKVGVTNWNATAAGAAKPLVWVVGMPLASTVKRVQVTDANGGIASVEQAFTAQKTLNDGFKALYTAKVDVNGLIGGFGIYNDGTVVEAGFDVDKFWVGRTTNKVKPFIISGGVVYIDAARIGNAAIDTAKIAQHLNSSNFDGDFDGSGNIFNTGLNGWAIDKTGKAVFHNVIVRGDIQATSINGVIVDTGNVVAGAMSQAYAIKTVGSETTLTVNPVVVPANAAALKVEAINQVVTTFWGDDTSNPTYDFGTVTITNTTTGVSYSSAPGGGVVVGPPAGNYTVSCTRGVAAGYTPPAMQLLVVVYKR